MQDLERKWKIFLIMLMSLTTIKCYDLTQFNYTMEELILAHEEYKNDIALIAPRWLSDVRGECNCNFNRREAGCGCCAMFAWAGTQHKGCVSAGMDFSPIQFKLKLSYDDWNWGLTMQPEICFPIAFWGLIKICLALYYADVCIDDSNFQDSSFTACLQLDVVICFPIITVDFNCVALRNREIVIDDSIHSDRPGLITYKLGHGFLRDDNVTIIQVGRLPDDISPYENLSGMECTRITQYKQECKRKAIG